MTGKIEEGAGLRLSGDVGACNRWGEAVVFDPWHLPPENVASMGATGPSDDTCQWPARAG